MKFFIPKTTEIFGQTIRIEYEKNLKLNDEEVEGIASYLENLIVINASSNYVKTEEELTYVHELVHSILNNLSQHKLSENEKFVCVVSSLLHQYLVSAKYKKPKDFIPVSFSLFGQHIKVKEKVMDELSDSDTNQNIIYMASNKINPLIHKEKFEVAFLNQIMFFLLTMIGEQKLITKKFVFDFSYAFHQSLIKAVK